MKTKHINVANKVATYQARDGAIVCGNGDYIVHFAFDAEWDDYPNKTARFIWNGQYYDQDFTGDTCPVPVITKAFSVEVGVYIDGTDMRTTTSANIPCRRSVLCESGTQHPGSAEHYTNEAKEAAGRAEEAASIVQQIQGEGESSLQQQTSQALTDYSAAFGHVNLTGIKGFRFSEITYTTQDSPNDYIFIDTLWNDDDNSEPFFEIGDVISISTCTSKYPSEQHNFINCATVTGRDPSVIHGRCRIMVTKLPFVDHTDEDHYYQDGTENEMYHAVFVLKRPTMGDRNLGRIAGLTYGMENVALGRNALAGGRYCYALDNQAVALGHEAIASENSAFALGTAVKSEGRHSFTIGHGTRANSYAAFASGKSTSALAEEAATFGTKTTARGTNSLAFGTSPNSAEEIVNRYNAEHGTKHDINSLSTDTALTLWNYTGDEKTCFTFARGADSLAGGDGCIATGKGSVALGFRSKATNSSTFSLGTWNEATGSHSNALGTWTRATAYAQTALGKYNKENSEAMLMVGCGTSKGRMNAFEACYNTTDGKYIKIGDTKITEAQLKNLLALL